MDHRIEKFDIQNIIEIKNKMYIAGYTKNESWLCVLFFLLFPGAKHYKSGL